MKRDMDVVRDLFIKISDNRIDEIDFKDPTICYHIEMLVEQADYVRGIIGSKHLNGDRIWCPVNPRLTWLGNEFLDTIKPQSFWNKIKVVLQEKGIGLTIDAIKLAAPIAMKALLP